MTFKEKVELAMYMALWTQSMIKDIVQDDYQWHDFATKVVTRPTFFTDKTAKHVYRAFRVTSHTEWQLDNLKMLVVRHRPELALELKIVRSQCDLVAAMIRDSTFSNDKVRQEVNRFMSQSTIAYETLEIFHVLSVHRPLLAAEFDYHRPTVH